MENKNWEDKAYKLIYHIISYGKYENMEKC